MISKLFRMDTYSEEVAIGNVCVAVGRSHPKPVWTACAQNDGKLFLINIFYMSRQLEFIMVVLGCPNANRVQTLRLPSNWDKVRTQFT